MDSFKGIRICFLADKHDLFDDRIYWKMAVPLHILGAEVHYYLIGPKAAEGTTKEGVHFRILKVKGYAENPYLNFVLKRLNPFNNYRRLLREAASLEADIYHFHDLWLNRIAPRLKSLPHEPVVFYDAREPYAEDYRSFFGSGAFSRSVVDAFASWVDRWEKNRSHRYDLVIANEPVVRNQFASEIGEEKAVVLYNFADIQPLAAADAENGNLSFDLREAAVDLEGEEEMLKKYDVMYCGLLTEQRGAFSVLEAIRRVREKRPGIRALILGRIEPPSLKDRMLGFIREEQLEESIELHDQVPHEEIGRHYRQSKIGLILWKPLTSLKIKMPIKLFEYMAYGLPVIGSDFGHIREYIEKDGCGITVDAENPQEVAEAIDILLREENMYRSMRRHGLEASKSKYRWGIEFERLSTFYKKALNERNGKRI